MSYCRWSSDDFSCDVYVYANISGKWTTHVAGNKPVGEIPKVPPLTKEGLDEYVQAVRQQMDWLGECDRAPIGLPHDGETFDDDTPGDCADRLEYLKQLGYIVPQYAIDRLREEQKEMNDAR